MACHLLDAKPLCEPMLTYCEIWNKNTIFIWEQYSTLIWKYHQQNDGHFILTTKCLNLCSANPIHWDLSNITDFDSKHCLKPHPVHSSDQTLKCRYILVQNHSWLPQVTYSRFHIIWLQQQHIKSYNRYKMTWLFCDTRQGKVSTTLDGLVKRALI